ncbi:MAG TPA: limonene-1,2-epoxide hydrolase family protein [Acidimicrobiales bacterium]
MYLIVVDLEASCWEAAWVRHRMEIIEIGAVRLDEQLTVVDEFDSFVRPVAIPRLSSFCTKLTTITQAQVDAADTFPDVFARFLAWIGPKPYRLTTWGAFDIGQFRLDCGRHGLLFPEQLAVDHLNLKSKFTKWKGVRRVGMTEALDLLGLPHTGTHHRGIDDARNIVRIAQVMLPQLSGPDGVARTCSVARVEQPIETVERFCKAWPELDLDKISAFFSEDAVYHNIPLAPVTGRDAIKATIASFTTGVDRIEFEILHAAANGNVVLTERVDRFFSLDRTIELPVMGTFEVTDGSITAWRDYFDLNQFLSQTTTP